MNQVWHDLVEKLQSAKSELSGLRGEAGSVDACASGEELKRLLQEIAGEKMKEYRLIQEVAEVGNECHSPPSTEELENSILGEMQSLFDEAAQAKSGSPEDRRAEADCQ